MIAQGSSVVRRGAALGVAVLAVAGCGPYPPGPLPSPTTTRTIGPTTQVLPYAGAPAVRDPLPVTVVSGDPCTTALTPEQVRHVLGAEVTGKRDRNESAGPACLWENPATARTILVAYATRHRQGLSAVYPSRPPEEGRVWRALEVEGFPAVADTRDPPWYCTVTVGLADDMAVEVSLVGRADDGGDVCVVTVRTAELVVGTLRKQAGR
ncbi:DUF3558 family protein [Amycolatopsis sp. lyj-112]|uniref:DUF3558 family protein n=1 Tax=Amycolatopsis sp. lyj-112 TaxID=2789288 RepID=UPI00397C445C